MEDTGNAMTPLWPGWNGRRRRRGIRSGCKEDTPRIIYRTNTLPKELLSGLCTPPHSEEWEVELSTKAFE